VDRIILSVQPDPLAVLGHEVRNLIATFVGFSELLLSQEWPPDKQREYLETMRDEGVRVSRFLNELLDLQRLESGEVALTPRPVDVTALLKFAADVAAHDPRHPIRLDLQADLPLALADSDRIQQVLANLLSNARKYSPQGGYIELSSRPAGRYVEVSVEDHGVGIPHDALERVFDKFYRVESLLHRNVRGTGLGLTICRQIVEAHSGRVWAESSGLGQGARVCFTLPRVPSTAGMISRRDLGLPQYDDAELATPPRCTIRRPRSSPSPGRSTIHFAMRHCCNRRLSTPPM
jgi:signal transduction histidine kinase